MLMVLLTLFKLDIHGLNHPIDYVPGGHGRNFIYQCFAWCLYTYL